MTLTEWRNIDLLALDAWQSASVVGYEIKVSRSDMRSELLKPAKRAEAVAMCTEFYFAVPAGLLTPAEREWYEPTWEPADFHRTPCTNPDCSASHQRRGFARRYAKARGKTYKGTDIEGVTVRLGDGTDRGVDKHGATYTHHFVVVACCAVCKGYGTIEKSFVERVAPTLWVPRDVGLVVVGSAGIAQVLKKSPVNKLPEPIIPWPYTPGTNSRLTPENSNRVQRQTLAQLVRWASFRPDPRHR